MEQRDGSTFPYERAVTMGLGALLVSALVALGSKIVDLSIAMERKADAEPTRVSIGVIDRDLAGIKLSYEFNRMDVDRRLGAIETQIRATRRTEN